MNCIVCNYKWCWICGNSLSHWVHKFEFLPFTCSKAPVNKKSKVFFFLYFTLGLILMPMIIYLTVLALSAYFCIDFFFKTFDKKSKCINSCCGCLIIVPFFMAYFLIALVLSAVVAGIAAFLLLLPAYYIHIYCSYSAYQWWNNQARSIEQTKPV